MSSRDLRDYISRREYQSDLVEDQLSELWAEFKDFDPFNYDAVINFDWDETTDPQQIEMRCLFSVRELWLHQLRDAGRFGSPPVPLFHRVNLDMLEFYYRYLFHRTAENPYSV